MKKCLKTLIIGMLISSSPLLGNEINKFQEVPQITISKENGQEGKASHYGGNYHHGRKMANGKIFDKNALTCAHNSYPFGTKLKVSYQGKSVVVTVTDRGGFNKLGRVIDLSEGAFKKLAPLSKGVIKVKIEKLWKFQEESLTLRKIL